MQVVAEKETRRYGKITIIVWMRYTKIKVRKFETRIEERFHTGRHVFTAHPLKTPSTNASHILLRTGPSTE